MMISIERWRIYFFAPNFFFVPAACGESLDWRLHRCCCCCYLLIVVDSVVVSTGETMTLVAPEASTFVVREEDAVCSVWMSRWWDGAFAGTYDSRSCVCERAVVWLIISIHGMNIRAHRQTWFVFLGCGTNGSVWGEWYVQMWSDVTWAWGRQENMCGWLCRHGCCFSWSRVIWIVLDGPEELVRDFVIINNLQSNDRNTNIHSVSITL